MDAFSAPGEWLRCQLHCHTDCSDGEPTVDELVAHYDAAGCDVLAITDHWLITRFEHPRMLCLPASELSSALDRAPFEAEVLALGIDELPEPREEFPTIEACAAWIAEHGGVAFLAHPHWSSLVADDIVAAPSLAGLEVFNGGSEVHQGRGLSEVHWDMALQLGASPTAIATDDAHEAGGARGSDSRLGWTMVKAAARTREAVVEALRAGAFYATTGPELLDVAAADDGSVTVRCSPAAAVALRSGAWDGGRVNADPAISGYRGEILERDADGLITGARFEQPAHWPWGRIDLWAADGGRAWSNPLRLACALTPFR